MFFALALMLDLWRPVAFEEWPIFAFQVLLASAPFAALAFRGIRSSLPWLVALILTAAVWCAYFASVLIAVRDETGAPIGMGMILTVSPFVIAAAALFANRLTRKRS
jgi:hypothetical protein